MVPCPAGLEHLNFRIERANISTVGSAFKSGGFKRLLKGHEWNALWGKLNNKRYRELGGYQKINHFPGTYNLGRKDSCARNIDRMRRRVGEAQCVPFKRCYHLPGDRPELEADMEVRGGPYNKAAHL